MRPQPLIAVTDVAASSRWYRRLLGCASNHGGPVYEQLVADGQLILQLHSFESDHDHAPIGNRDLRPYGNGVLLWFGDGGPNHWECWMRDPDGYVVVVSSPYGTADGGWQPEGNPFRGGSL